ncbi:hypothetical protein CEUSTIGMA_g3645.t1 [Chlamydomonas eustigma]|uniref:Uncharacterized protein n=1 Tax=Chlamydomonas eustigma TaxID=1157962 RepID=A0A250WZE4_9CHLO|nr:hypothetical protein CEUSTIGMA_g3645.t1 [Chlamydomonas eustigma]|eukprot:GAX76201.1 hypothetical protein CEUSTIGMA_g3645.t1 [Chlamydomonas eustigma]
MTSSITFRQDLLFLHCADLYKGMVIHGWRLKMAPDFAKEIRSYYMHGAYSRMHEVCNQLGCTCDTSVECLKDLSCKQWYYCHNIFPNKDSCQANLRFAISFITSIHLGGLTDAMLAYNKRMLP